MNPRAQEIIDFWFKETPSEKRFKKDEKFDQLIREKFLNDYEKASLNEYDDWQDTALGSLALVILFDQFCFQGICLETTKGLLNKILKQD